MKKLVTLLMAWGLFLVVFAGDVRANCTMLVRADFNGDGIVKLDESKTIERDEGHSVCSFDAPTARFDLAFDYDVCDKNYLIPEQDGSTGIEYLYTCKNSVFEKQMQWGANRSCQNWGGFGSTGSCIDKITGDFSDPGNDAECAPSPECTSPDGTKVTSANYGCYNDTSWGKCWKGNFVCIESCGDGKCRSNSGSLDKYKFQCYDQSCPDYNLRSGEDTCEKDNTNTLRVRVECIDGIANKTTCGSNELCVEENGKHTCVSTLAGSLCTQDEGGNEMQNAINKGDTVCYNDKISICNTVPRLETKNGGDCVSDGKKCYDTKQTDYIPTCLTETDADNLGIKKTLVTVNMSTDSSFLCNDGSGIETAFGCIPYTVSGLTSKLLPFLFGIAGGISFLLMVYGFIMVATSSGDEKKLVEARSRITSAVVGLLVSIFALFLFRLIAVNILQIPGI